MNGFRWKKLGLVWRPDGSVPDATTHAMGPTPFLLNEDVIRVFITCLDPAGRGRPFWVDVSSCEPTRVLKVCAHAAMDIGEPGTFDDNGLMAISMVRPAAGELWMYYAGFEICTKIRYRILSGVARSVDDGVTFERISRAPVLERSDREMYFRGGPFAMIDDGRFKLWYVAGSNWTEMESKPMPVYDLRYQESADGLNWGREGRLSMAITGADEHGFGRPWVVKRGPADYELFYSVRRRSFGAYRLGYAISTDGIGWTRLDEQMGLDVSPGGFDSDAIMYSAVITVHGRTWCFYNGNEFGRDGFAVAELMQ